MDETITVRLTRHGRHRRLSIMSVMLLWADLLCGIAILRSYLAYGYSYSWAFDACMILAVLSLFALLEALVLSLPKYELVSQGVVSTEVLWRTRDLEDARAALRAAGRGIVEGSIDIVDETLAKRAS